MKNDLKIGSKTRLAVLLTAAALLSGCSYTAPYVYEAETTESAVTEYAAAETTAATSAETTAATSAETAAETSVPVTAAEKIAAAAVTAAADETEVAAATQKVGAVSKEPSFEDAETLEILDDEVILCGLLERSSVGYSESIGDLVMTEADYGFSEAVTDRIVALNGYDYTGGSIRAVTAYLSALDDKEDIIKTVAFDADGICTFDTSELPVGVYRVTAEFSAEKNNTMQLFFYVKENRTYACLAKVRGKYQETAEEFYELYKERREKLAEAMKEAETEELSGGFAIDGSKSLQLDLFYYPNYPYVVDGEAYRCDTELWEDVAKEITEEDWTKEHKAFVMCQWLRDNIAYDSYAASFDSRCIKNQDWSGKYFVYNIKTGVCWDFTNIYAIMCRA